MRRPPLCSRLLLPQLLFCDKEPPPKGPKAAGAGRTAAPLRRSRPRWKPQRRHVGRRLAPWRRRPGRGVAPAGRGRRPPRPAPAPAPRRRGSRASRSGKTPPARRRRRPAPPAGPAPTASTCPVVGPVQGRLQLVFVPSCSAQGVKPMKNRPASRPAGSGFPADATARRRAPGRPARPATCRVSAACSVPRNRRPRRGLGLVGRGDPSCPQQNRVNQVGDFLPHRKTPDSKQKAPAGPHSGRSDAPPGTT